MEGCLMTGSVQAFGTKHGVDWRKHGPGKGLWQAKFLHSGVGGGWFWAFFAAEGLHGCWWSAPPHHALRYDLR